MHGDRVRGRVPRHRQPAAPARSTRRQPATRATSRTAWRSRAHAHPEELARLPRPLRPRPALQRQLDAAVRARAGQPARAPTAPSCSPRARPTTARPPPSRRARTACRPLLLAAPAGYSTLALPDVGDLRLLKRRVRIRGRADARPSASASRWRPSRTRSEASRARSSSPGSWRSRSRCWPRYLIGTRLSRPLRRMAAVAARVDAGDLHPRIHDRAVTAMS